ncbi:hypothetical protein DVH24_032144 [Malus domestica]|uniref:DDT domain-containing protein n=1 Tax=Malus domestica TaxID=3750 RepID=A0A498J562_MALDO|nr:hypothetical protein DVH24_032144 [Malus domestica]
MHEAKKKGYQSVADMLRVEKLQKKENGDSKDGKGRMHVASDKGTPLTTVAGVKLAAEDVGNALKFLKFCETFREFFKIEKSQAQSVLRELFHGGSGRNGRPGQSLEQASNNWSWFQDLVKLVSASGVSKVDPVMKELPAETLRGWIEEQKERSVQCKRDMKAKVALAKDKERDIQAKLQEQMAKRATPENSDAVPISESDSIASVLRSEAAQAHTEVVKAMAMVPQNLGTWDGTPSGERWFVCGAEMKAPIDKYRSSLALKEKQPKREQGRSKISSSKEKKLQLSQKYAYIQLYKLQGSGCMPKFLYKLLHGKADHNYFVTGNVNFKMSFVIVIS